MQTSIFIRISGILIGYVVFSTISIFTYGVDLIFSEQPLMALPGIANILWWLCGLFSTIMLLIVHNYARWLLFVFFLLSFVSAAVEWIPGVWYVSNLVATGISQFIVLQAANFIFVLVVFKLYSVQQKQSNQSVNT